MDPEKGQIIPDSQLSGFWASVFNVMNTAIGSGIIGLPYAASKTGYGFFTVALLLVALMAYYSIDLLTEIGEYFQANSYEEIAGAVFNKRWQGKRMVGLRLAAFFI